jgi:hypothetical protein
MSDDTYKQNTYSYMLQSWHKKGIVGNMKESAEDIYNRMEKVEFVQSPATFNVNGFEIKNNVIGIFKVDGGKIKMVGNTKDRYKLYQPIEYIKKFDEMVGKYVETMGFLGAKADKLFITWNLPKIDIHGDEMQLFGMISVGFDGVYGNHLFNTKVRTVCKNTHAMAVSDANANENYGFGANSNGAIVTTRHTQKEHVDILGYWMRYVDQESERQVEMMRNLFCKMEEKPLSVDDAYGFFSKVFSDPKPNKKNSMPVELRDNEDERFDKDEKKIKESRDLAMSLFQGAGIEISKTVYGGYNSVTEMMNHKIISKKTDGVDSILLGSRATVMDKAFNVAVDYVTVR